MNQLNPSHIGFRQLKKLTLPKSILGDSSPGTVPTDETKLGERPQVPSSSELPVSLGNPSKDSTAALLKRMKPYLRDVHVVLPPKNGAPAVLGGRGVENSISIPQNLKSIPTKRWVVTPEIEAFHTENLVQSSNKELRDENQELKRFVAPLLAKRYGQTEGNVAVELGPATNVDLARSLQGESGKNIYFGMDISKPLLDRARELTHEPGYQIADAYQVYGDTYRMPFNDDVADVVCVSCHPPFFSAESADKIRALSEVKRVLKPGGEFALFPWNAERDQVADEYLKAQFDIMESHSESPDRQLLILRAKD